MSFFRWSWAFLQMFDFSFSIHPIQHAISFHFYLPSFGKYHFRLLRSRPLLSNPVVELLGSCVLFTCFFFLPLLLLLLFAAQDVNWNGFWKHTPFLPLNSKWIESTWLMAFDGRFSAHWSYWAEKLPLKGICPNTRRSALNLFFLFSLRFFFCLHHVERTFYAIYFTLYLVAHYLLIFLSFFIDHFGYLFISHLKVNAFGPILRNEIALNYEA